MTRTPPGHARRRATRWLASLLVAAGVSGCEGRSAEQTDDGGERRQVVGTFRVEAPVTGAQQGRLPAADDLAAYIPATNLFPGTARIDPAVANPYSGDPQAVAAGERHYAAFNCGGCHAPLGGGGMGPPLSDDVWIYGGAPAQIYLSILHGRPQGMPAWGSMLPARTIWELVTYIETLNDIPDPTAAKGFDSLEVRTARQPGPDR